MTTSPAHLDQERNGDGRRPTAWRRLWAWWTHPAHAVWREWVESALVALVLALFLRTFVVQAFRIPSGSMRPTLIEGDRLLVDKLAYGPRVPLTRWRLPGYSHPKTGDVIVFIYPVDPHKDFIKRLVAKGGDTVEIRRGHVYVNGRRVRHPVMDKIYYYNRGAYGREGHPVRVPEGFYYVLGDNSASSHDSRYWGFVPEHALIGRAFFIYWPPSRIRRIR